MFFHFKSEPLTWISFGYNGNTAELTRIAYLASVIFRKNMYSSDLSQVSIVRVMVQCLSIEHQNVIYSSRY